MADTYISFSRYFMDEMLGRKYFYGVIFAVGICCLVFAFYGMRRRRKYVEICACIVAIVLIPMGANIIEILLPGNMITEIMRYHYVLIVPFCFFLLGKAKSAGICYKIMKSALCICTVIIVYSYVLSANATFTSLRVSYRAIDTQTKLILADVYDLDGYSLNETKIVFAGVPDDHIVRSSLGIYDFAMALPDNAAYWLDMNGLNVCRQRYLLNYCGVEAGYINADEYRALVESVEFQDMPVWPAEGSVKMINGVALVKISSEPPMP